MRCEFFGAGAGERGEEAKADDVRRYLYMEVRRRCLPPEWEGVSFSGY